MKLLIEAGGDPDHVDEEGQTPIFYATRAGQEECINCLINEYNVDFNREDGQGANLVRIAHRFK